MKNARTQNANDNNDPWQTLSAATDRVLKSNKEQDEEAGDTERKQEEKRKAHRDYVYRRLCELAAFEARAHGAGKRR